MAFSVESWVLSNKYTDDSIRGISGVLAGKNCTISSIEQDENKNQVITFKWFADDGTEKTDSAIIPSGIDTSTVYVGAEEPTDENVQLWINPYGTPDEAITNYENLDNLPKINNVKLIGNSSLEDLDIASSFDLSQTNMSLEILNDTVNELEEAIMDGSYELEITTLGSMAGKTLSQIQEIIMNWVNQNLDVGAIATFVIESDFIQKWNDNDITYVAGTGGTRWTASIVASYPSQGYITLQFATYSQDSKEIYYVSEWDGVFKKIYKIATVDDYYTKTETEERYGLLSVSNNHETRIENLETKNQFIDDTDYITEQINFNNKVGAWFGDSITKGFLTSTTTVENPFAKVFSNFSRMTYNNFAITSSLWTSGYREIDTFLDVIKTKDLSHIDILFINGGINDYHSSVTKSDFTNAVEETFLYLSNNFNGKVIVISPINSVESELTFNPLYNLNMYRNIIKKKCIEYGYSYISGETLAGASTKCFASEIYFVDNYHLNQAGHYLVAKNLANKILNANIDEIYSEEEQVCGMYFGKPLYRKIVHTGQLPNTATTLTVNHNAQNVSKIVKLYGVGYNSNGTIAYTLPWSSNSENSNISLYAGITKITITVGKDQSTTIYDSYVTIEYTKNTDY